jgi:hypothetical protein
MGRKLSASVGCPYKVHILFHTRVCEISSTRKIKQQLLGVVVNDHSQQSKEVFQSKAVDHSNTSS